MHEIHELYKRYKIYCIFGGILILACVWFCLAGRGDVSNISKRADSVRNELRQAGDEQREQAGSLDRTEEAIRDSAERADRVQEIERSDAAVIRESQSILAAVRGRGKKEN